MRDDGGSGAAFDTSALNSSERRVLAAGHTAKSIAIELDLTVHSVNERLREARRKAGAGSSRELARLVATQENRDKQIGLAAARASDISGPRVDHHPEGRRRWHKEALVVIIVSIIGLTAWGLAPRILGNEVDDPYRKLATPAADTATLYRELRTERHDRGWAAAATTRLQNIYASVPGVELLRVTCGASLCEVAGQIVPGEEPSTTSALQDASVTKRAAAAGFGSPVAFAVGMDDADRASRFLAYWPRHRAT